MRSSWISGVGPKSSDRDPYKRDRKERKRSWEDRGRDWSDVATSQRMPAALRS